MDDAKRWTLEKRWPLNSLINIIPVLTDANLNSPLKTYPFMDSNKMGLRPSSFSRYASIVPTGRAASLIRASWRWRTRVQVTGCHIYRRDINYDSIGKFFLGPWCRKVDWRKAGKAGYKSNWFNFINQVLSVSPLSRKEFDVPHPFFGFLLLDDFYM